MQPVNTNHTAPVQTLLVDVRSYDVTFVYTSRLLRHGSLISTRSLIPSTFPTSLPVSRCTWRPPTPPSWTPLTRTRTCHTLNSSATTAVVVSVWVATWQSRQPELEPLRALLFDCVWQDMHGVGIVTTIRQSLWVSVIYVHLCGVIEATVLALRMLQLSRS